MLDQEAKVLALRPLFVQFQHTDNMDRPKVSDRDSKRPSIERSRSRGSATKDTQATPTFLTSFPSLSPPEVKSKPKIKQLSPSLVPHLYDHPVDRKNTQNIRTVSTPVSSIKDGDATNGSPGGSNAVNRTVMAAVNLRKTIMETITSQNASQVHSPKRIFTGSDVDGGDPLAGATEDHVLRIISSCGGPVSTVRKYSSDLAETNERVASERNNKLRLVEENRELRAQSREKDDEIEELKNQMITARNLFARYVHKMQPDLHAAPQIQILQSPAGPYALEDTSGSILATLNDKFVFPDGTSGVVTDDSSFANEEAVPELPPRSGNAVRPERSSRTLKVPPTLPKRLVSTVRTETVEMKSPVDIGMLPPALRDASTPNEALVDRLGFYITADREKRHQEASRYKPEEASESSSIDSGQKEDDDSAQSTSELLCDAPMMPAARLIFRSESSAKIFVEVDKDEPFQQESSGFASPVTTTHVAGGMATPSATSSLAALLGPIQDSKALSSLLVKLNQAYDMQQKRRTNAWAAFYEQTRELLQRGTDDKLDEHNVTGVTALSSASHVSAEIRSTFSSLIRRGVPVSFRREVWLERSGANNVRDPELYHMLVAQGLDDPVTQREIAVDVDRTLSNNVFFRDGIGKSRLRDVLVAFARQNPDIGYSQGLNIIAANLLLMVPSPEDGFALLEVLVKDILPHTYYAKDGAVSGQILERDGQVVASYVSEHIPSLYKHMIIQGAPLTMFTPGWFISAFAACVNGEALYRLWDLIFGFCDGRFVFCFALALLKLNRRGLMACVDAEELMSYLGGRMSTAAVSLDTLINETFKMGEKVTLKDIEKRREAVTKKMNA